MGHRRWVRRLEREAEVELVAVRQADGTVARFRAEEVFPECFVHETSRWRRSFKGEDPGPAHPFVEALRKAPEAELERLASEQGAMVLHFLGEDEIMRGERKRPGAPARETAPAALADTPKMNATPKAGATNALCRKQTPRKASL